MNNTAQDPDWINQFRTDPSLLPVVNDHKAGWLEAIRSNALRQFQDEPLPNRKMERWRYTPVGKLFGQPFGSNISRQQLGNDTKTLFTESLDAIQVLIINGETHLVDIPDDLPVGVTIESMRKASRNPDGYLSKHIGSALNHSPAASPLGVQALVKDSRLFEHLNQSVTPDGLFVHVSAGVKLNKPIEVVFLQDDSEAVLIQSHNVIVLEAGAEMTLIERHISRQSTDSFSNNQLELIIKERAKLKHHYLQDQNQSAWHRHGINRLQSDSSEYSGWFGCFGSQWSRLEINTFFIGENAVSEINGVQLASGSQINDIHVDVRHELPNCHSEQHFRGLAGDQGKIVFDGNISVAQDAQKTVAHLSDKNLMLGRNCEVDAKPQLEIYADDVQCSHGTSIGELDEQQVFYLRSRGIPQQQAINLLSLGFVAELTDKIQSGPIRDLIVDSLQYYLGVDATETFTARSVEAADAG